MLVEKVTSVLKEDVGVTLKENRHLKALRKDSREVWERMVKTGGRDEKEIKDTKVCEEMLVKWDHEVTWGLRCVYFVFNFECYWAFPEVVCSHRLSDTLKFSSCNKNRKK